MSASGGAFVTGAQRVKTLFFKYSHSNNSSLVSRGRMMLCFFHSILKVTPRGENRMHTKRYTYIHALPGTYYHYTAVRGSDYVYTAV